MPITVICPGCQTSYNLPENARGMKVRCRKCNCEFTAPAKAPGKQTVMYVEAVEEAEMAEHNTRPAANSGEPFEAQETQRSQVKAKSRALPLALLFGGLGMVLVIFVGICGTAAWFYFRGKEVPSTEATAGARTGDGEPVSPKNSPEKNAAARSLDELKAATVFIKVAAGPVLSLIHI